MHNLHNNSKYDTPREFSRTLAEHTMPKAFFPACGHHHSVRTGVYGHIFRTFDNLWNIYREDNGRDLSKDPSKSFSSVRY